MSDTALEQTIHQFSPQIEDPEMVCQRYDSICSLYRASRHWTGNAGDRWKELNRQMSTQLSIIDGKIQASLSKDLAEVVKALQNSCWALRPHQIIQDLGLPGLKNRDLLRELRGMSKTLASSNAEPTEWSIILAAIQSVKARRRAAPGRGSTKADSFRRRDALVATDQLLVGERAIYRRLNELEKFKPRMKTFAPDQDEERRDSVLAFAGSDEMDIEIDTTASTVVAHDYVVPDRGRRCGMRTGAAIESEPEEPPMHHSESATTLYESTGDMGISEEDAHQPAVYRDWIRRDARERSWLPDQPAWPRGFAPSLATSNYIGPRVGGAEDADVLFLTEQELDAKVRAGELLDKPIVVHGHTFSDAQEHTLASFARKLRSYFNGKQVDVRRPNEEAPVKIDVGEFAKRLADDRGASDDSCNALNLVSIAHAVKPTFTQHSRFELLDVLVQRAKSLGPGKQMITEPQFSDVESCLSFNICAERGSSSFAHVDALVGTWMRNLFGVKLWVVVPQNQMDKQDWERFAADGDRWDPQGKGRLVVLRKGDVFLMPPGLPVVHAVFTPEVCGMEGGMLWDNTNIVNILRSMLWIHQNPKSTNEDFPRQLPSIMNALLEWLDDEPQYFVEDDVQIREAIRELSTQLGCRCTKKCGADCECGGRCTEWCHGKKTRVCMQ